MIAACWVAVALSPLPARAYEDQLSLGVGAGYAYATRPDSPHHGAAFQLDASLGISPTWSVRAVAGYSLHPATRRLSRLTLAAEAIYLVDVLQVVPYAGFGLDALASLVPDATPDLDVGVHPVAGVDWLLSRSFLLGVCVRPIFVLSRFETQPVYLTASLTAAWLLEL